MHSINDWNEIFAERVRRYELRLSALRSLIKRQSAMLREWLEFEQAVPANRDSSMNTRRRLLITTTKKLLG